MSASWDSDLSSIIEKTNNNLKLLRKIGDKPQVRASDVSLSRAGSAAGSASSHASARPRTYVGAQDDAGSASSRGSARPRAFIRGDDDTSSMGSRGSARPKAFVRGDEDSSSIGSHASARPRVYVGAQDDAGSSSSRASARPKAFVRADDDAGSVSSRASARPKAFIRADDDSGSMSSRSSARPRAFVRGDDDSGSMSSNQGLGRARLDSGHGSSASASSRPHVGIAGGGGLTAAMLQQHRATAGGPGGVGDLNAPRPRLDVDETRSMSGSVSSRLRRGVGATGRVPHARPLGASMGPRIRVPDADIPSDVPNHMIEEVTKSLETHFAARNGAVDKKVADLRTDVAGLTTQTSALSSQITELRDAVLVSANSKLSANAPAVSDPKIIASVQANAAAIARLEEHSADLLGRKVSVDRELTEMGTRVKSLSSATMKISTLEDNIEALVANRQKQEQGLFKLADRVQLMHRQMGSLVDMKAVENLLSIRLTREFREMEDRLSQNVIRMTEKMEQKVQSLEKQSFSQRQESLAALKNDLSDDIQRLQSSALRKSDLLPLQNAQTQSKEDVAQLSSALDRQEKKLLDAKISGATLRDELADARTELNKALHSQQQRSAAAVMEEKLEQIASSSKEKSNKFDDQLSELAQKQKKLEEATKTLEETMTQVKTEANQRIRRSSTDREEENDKLRQRLARSVAELEALATTKAQVERRFASEEQQFRARLKELRSTLTETEKQKETQRLELVQKLQEESKLMGVAQGKSTLLENLLAREKAENEEKSEVARKSKKEVAEVREQIRNLESEKEKKVRQLTSELQAKQTQVGLLTKTLKRIETASAKMLDLSKREAKTVRRVKATKEHELFLAQLKLKEMERVAQALQNGDEMKKQAALTAASTEERNDLEKLLLDSQLEKDELKQELEEMTEEFNAAKESQKQIMEDTITKLSSDYDDKIGELKQQIADKEQAMRQLRDTLVEKGNLDALEDELSSLKDEKNDLLEQIQRAQIEHERVTLKTETNMRLEHATEFAAMKSKFQERISELEGAQSELETTKTTIAELEKEIENQEALHQREVSTLTHEIKEARSKIDECTAQILELEETKAHLESEVSQLEANIGGASAEREEELAAIKNQMQTEVDKLRGELSIVSTLLEEKQTLLKEAKHSDESNRQRLVEMAMTQEEMQSRYVTQIDLLSLKLDQERESSRSREQELEDTIDKLNSDVKSLKSESSKDIENVRSELTDQLTELTTTLKASQHREQQLQSRLKRILEELVQAANASGKNEVVEDAEVSDDEAITHHLDALYATHRRTAHELERLQAEYELTVKQATADSATAQELDNQVKEHETQIRELESVVEQLRGELKEQYHKSAIIAKGSDEFSDEMANLREEKRQLELQLQEEEKDRAKREVSYQRRTEMKEREVEELRTENKTLTAAVAAVREKIRAVENVKYHDLGELQSKLNDLEERTAALQPDENNVVNLEKDFTTTRQEIVTLTAEVQSLYQKLTVCCGIMEWSELRASVFDEEEKLTRVRSESAREIAKVQSVEQQVLMNAEFLNALLVAHGSTGGDENLLNDFRWMQKYASIAPEIVEKLRKVESRLRDAVLDLHDDSSSLFPDSVSQGPPQPPNSQKSAVDGAAIALALEKAKEDYFSETSEAAQEDDLDDAEEAKHDMDQPDVEHEGEEIPVGEGASYENVDVDRQDSIGDMSRDESEVCDEMVVAEHVVRDEQESSHDEQGAASLEMSSLDEDSSVDVAEGSFKSKQDRIDDVDGLVSDVDRKIEMTKMQSTWSSVGFSGRSDDDMNEVERLMEQSLAHSSKQVKPHIDNERDDSDEFATPFVYNETEEKQPETRSGEVGAESVDDEELGEETVDDTKMTEHHALHDHARSMNVTEEEVEQAELSDSEQGVKSSDEADELDPLEESSFDDAMISALESKEALASSDVDEKRQQSVHLNKSEELADSREGVVHNAVDESSFDNSMVSENDNEYSRTRLTENPDVAIREEDDTGIVESPRIAQNLQVEHAFNGDANVSDEQTPEQPGDALVNEDTLEKSASSLDNGALGDQLDKNNALEESMGNVGDELNNYDSDFEESSSSLVCGTLTDQHCDDNALEQSSSSMASGASADHLDNANALEESVSSVENNVLADQLEWVEETEVLKDSTSSAPSGAVGVGADDVSDLEESTSSDTLVNQLYKSDVIPSMASGLQEDTADEENDLEKSPASMASDLEADHADKDFDLGESTSRTHNAGLADQPDKDNKFDESSSSLDNKTPADRLDEEHELENSASSVGSVSFGEYEVGSPDRIAGRHTYGDISPLETDDMEIHGHIEHSCATTFHPNPLAESSFDADMMSDGDGDISASVEAELSPQPVKHLEEEDQNERSADQLRQPERSLERGLAVEDDNTPAMSLRLEEDESSEEEETVPVQTQPTFAASHNRFGFGSRRLNLEEDEDMDEVENLLLQQSSSSMKTHQQQISRSTKHLADDDDEFGDKSHDDDDGEFGIVSIRSQEEFGEDSIQSRSDEFDEGSVKPRSRENDEFGKASSQLLVNASERFKASEDVEFGEASIQSLNDAFGEDSVGSKASAEGDDMDEIERLLLQESSFSKTKQQSGRYTNNLADGDDEFGGQSHGDDDALEELASSVGEDALTDQLERMEETEALEESSSSVPSGAVAVGSEEDSDLEESTASGYKSDVIEELTSSMASGFQEDEVHDLGESASSRASGLEEDHVDSDFALEEASSHTEDNKLDESSSSLDSKLLADRRDEEHELENSASSVGSVSFGEYEVGSPDRIAGRHTYGDIPSLETDDVEIHGHIEHSCATTFHPNPLAESSFDADMMSDGDGDISASVEAELSPQPVKHLEEEDQNERSADQLRQPERSLERGLAVEDDNTPAMSLRLEEDESSEEEETVPVQTQPTFAASHNRFGFGSRRLNLEEDEDMDEVENLLLQQSSSSMKTHQQQISRSTKHLADDDDEFGDKSHDDDDGEFGIVSIRSQEEFGEDSIQSRSDEFDEGSVKPRSRENDEFGKASSQLLVNASERFKASEDVEFGEASIQSLNDAFGEDSVGSKASAEDDDMDEIERLLLQESSFSKTKQQSGRYTNNLADGDDEFGGQSHGDDDALEELASSVGEDALTDQLERMEETEALEESSSSVPSGAVAVGSEEDSDLEESTASGYKSDVIEELTSSMASGFQEDEVHDLGESASSRASGLEEDHVDSDFALEEASSHTEDNKLDESSSSLDSKLLADRRDEEHELENSASSVGSVSFGEYEVGSPDRIAGRHTYGDIPSLETDDVEIHGHIEHSCATTFHPNPLAESSFDADMMSDGDGDISASVEAELSPQPVKHLEEEDQNERSADQLRQPERSLERGLAVEDDNTPAMSLRLEEDESSEEEETVPVQTQPTFAASHNRFGFGSRRLNLEEDEDMDEVENLLLQQSSSSMKTHQQQISRSTKHLADDDDEFGDKSHDDDDGEFGIVSIRSQEEFGEDSIQSRSDEFDEGSVKPRSRENDEFGKASSQLLVNASERFKASEDVEFGEASIQSLNDAFGEDSVGSKASAEDDDMDEIERLLLQESSFSKTKQQSGRYTNNLADGDDEFGGQSHGDDDALEELASSVGEDALTDQLERMEETEALEESSSSVPSGAVAVGSEEDSDLEESTASGYKSDVIEELTSSMASGFQEDEVHDLGESASSRASGLEEDHVDSDFALEEASSHTEDNKLDESSSSLDSKLLADRRDEEHELENSASSVGSVSFGEYEVGSPDRIAGRHTYGDIPSLETDDVEIHGHIEHSCATTFHPNPLAESSFDADMMSDGDGDISASVEAELSPQPVKHLEEEDQNERSADQLRQPERSLERGLAVEDDNTPAMSLRLEEDESSEEEETVPVQTQPTFAASHNRFGFGSRRLNLEEDEDMDEVENLLLQQSSSSMKTHQQQISRSTKHLADDDDEFGDKSHDDDDGEFGIVSIRSQEEFGEDSIQSRSDEFDEGSVKPRSRENDEFGKASSQLLVNASERFKASEDVEFGEASIQSLNDAFGEDSVGSNAREDDAFGESSIQAREKEFVVSKSREVDDDMDEVERLLLQQVSSSMRTHPSTKHLADDDDEFRDQSLGDEMLKPSEDDEFGEASIQSLNDAFGEDSVGSKASAGDEFGESSIQSREKTSLMSKPRVADEFNVSPIQSRNYEFGVASTRSKSHEKEALIHMHEDVKLAGSSIIDFGDDTLHSISREKDIAFGKRPIHARSFDKDEFGESSIGSKSHEEDEFGGGSLGSQEDEFGEVSLPLDDDDDTAIGAGAPLRSHVKLNFDQPTRTSDFTLKTTSQVGSKPSPMRSSYIRSPTFARATQLTVQDDNASEAEQDYMDESFDLDESMEDEDGDADARHV